MGDVPDYFILPMENEWPELKKQKSQQGVHLNSNKEVLLPIIIIIVDPTLSIFWDYFIVLANM